MRKQLFSVCAAAFLVVAQTLIAGPATQNGDVEITQGQRGKYIFFSKGVAVQNTSASPDMQYIGGGVEGGGFIYDIKADSFFRTPTSARYIVSPDFYAGENKIVKNGQTITLDAVYFGDPGSSYSKINIWAATPDLNRLFAMGYLAKWDVLRNQSRMVNYIFIYNSDGHIIDTVKPVWEMATEGDEFENSGYGERVNACNSDGTVLAGHSAYPQGNTNFTAAFWDLQSDTSFGIFESDDNCWGTLQAINNDGSIIIGDIAGKVWVIRYDRQAKSYTREQIPYSPGMGHSLSSGISETGLVLYIQQTESGAPDTRETYLYNIENGDLVKLTDYCKELYGVDINYPTATGMYISDDGRIITGWTYSNAVYYPYAIVLDNIQLYARPRNVIAKQIRGTANVNVTWQLPIKSMHTLTGFNIYRDGQKINSSLINASTKQYEDFSVAAGVHKYSVEALYGDSISGRSESADVLVIELSGCLPVQKIESSVVYNRTVQVNWGLPSSQMAAIPQQKGYTNNNLDIINMQDIKSYTAWSAIVIGDKLLVGERDRGGIKIYDAETYEYLEAVDIEGIDKVYNMAVNGNNLYVANNTKTITVVNLTNMTRSNTIPNRETNVLHIAYSPDLDGGNGGLYYGNAENLFSCNYMGLKRDTVFMNSVDITISGTAYHNGILYMFSQTGKKSAQLLRFDIATETVISTKELNDYPLIASMDEEGFLPVGLTLCVLPDSTIALGGMFGCLSKTNHFALFELLSSPSIEGYNLYRNTVKINNELIKGHYYEEDILSAGIYTYTVETVNANGCRAMRDDVQTSVTISPIGVCDKPNRVRAGEGAHSAILSWELPNDAGKLVGFNIYRNGNKIADKIIDVKYLDFNIDTGYYTYIVEAFYQNSCIAADTVEITIKNEGEMMPPLNLAATSTMLDSIGSGFDVFQVLLQWELPYFETPLALGFSNIPYSGVSLQNRSVMWAAVAWDKNLLNGYEDLYVVGMEYFIGNGVTRLDGFVFLNDTLVYMKQAENIAEAGWNTIMFDKQFSMNQPMEVVIGYKVAYENTQSVAVFDRGPKKENYSDLLSADGVQWFSLKSQGMDNNWCINALVVRKRDIHKIRSGNTKKGSAVFALPEGKNNIRTPFVKNADIMQVTPASTTPTVIAASESKTTSATLRLNGFNIYRNNEKQNDEPQTDLYYNDNNVAKGSYSYRVSAVYNEGGGEELSEPVVINLIGSTGIEDDVKEILISAYPNPTSQTLYINGEYKSLQIVDMAGIIVKKHNKSAKSIHVGDLSAGTYLLRFVLADAAVVMRKLVVR